RPSTLCVSVITPAFDVPQYAYLGLSYSTYSRRDDAVLARRTRSGFTVRQPHGVTANFPPLSVPLSMSAGSLNRPLKSTSASVVHDELKAYMLLTGRLAVCVVPRRPPINVATRAWLLLMCDRITVSHDAVAAP